MLLALLLAAAPSVLFVRADAGYGWYHSGSNPGLVYSASGMGFGITVGRMAGESLALHGALFGGSGLSRVPCRVAVDFCPSAGTQVLALGFGVTWFTPGDFFLSATAGPATLAMTGNVIFPGGPRFGLGARVGLGREWQLTSRFSLGASAQVLAFTDGSSALGAVSPVLALSASVY